MTQNNMRIAITGGIGSGKSAVADFIKEQGYNVISCDEVYKQLLNNADFLNMLSTQFGDILGSDGKLNRQKLSKIVFSDENKLQKLNSLTHPAIMEEALKQMDGEKVSFCEVPLLFEEGLEKLFDSVIVVLRDREKRISAVTMRDNLDVNEVISRINSQYDYDRADFATYYVIHNNSTLDNLQSKTIKVLDKILLNS